MYMKIKKSKKYKKKFIYKVKHIDKLQLLSDWRIEKYKYQKKTVQSQRKTKVTGSTLLEV